MNGTFNSFLDVLVLISVGGILGTFGQGMRTIVGLKKLNDRTQGGVAQEFSPSRLSLSLLIGFIAGGIGVLTARPENGVITTQYLLMLIGFGYAGPDFIEGFMKKSMPAAALQTAAGERHPNNDAI